MLGGFVPEGFCPVGVLSQRGFVLGGFVPGGFVPEGFCPYTVLYNMAKGYQTSFRVTEECSL